MKESVWIKLMDTSVTVLNHMLVSLYNCVDHRCKNEGVCLDKADGYICDCPQPYVGKLI